MVIHCEAERSDHDTRWSEHTDHSARAQRWTVGSARLSLEVKDLHDGGGTGGRQGGSAAQKGKATLGGRGAERRNGGTHSRKQNGVGGGPSPGNT